MKNKKISIVLLLSSMLASSCNLVSGEFDVSKIVYIVNSEGRENEEYTNLSKDPYNPSHPAIKGLGFSGWYTERQGGEKYDFSSGKSVSKLYAHWYDFDSMNDQNKLERFIDTLHSWCGTINKTVASTSFKYASVMSEYEYVGESGSVSERYDNFVKTMTYSPYYASADAEVRDDDAPMTAKQVNEKNFFLTTEDHIEKEADGSDSLITVYQYNKDHEGYSPSYNEDGYEKSTNVTNIENSMSIDFSAYFLGYPAILLYYMKAGHEFKRVTAEDTSIEGDYYYFEGVDPTAIDPYVDTGAKFTISYVVSQLSTSGYLWTDIYQTEASVAFKDGVISHCRVYKLTGTAINSETQEAYSYDSSYDFYQGSITREYTGTKLNYKDFNELVDEN